MLALRVLHLALCSVDIRIEACRRRFGIIQYAEVSIRLPKPVAARYLKFVALSEQTRQPFATIAELDVGEAQSGK